MHAHHLTVLEVRSPKWVSPGYSQRGGWDLFLPETGRGDCIPGLFPFLGSPTSLARLGAPSSISKAAVQHLPRGEREGFQKQNTFFEVQIPKNGGLGDPDVGLADAPNLSSSRRETENPGGTGRTAGGQGVEAPLAVGQAPKVSLWLFTHRVTSEG